MIEQDRKILSQNKMRGVDDLIESYRLVRYRGNLLPVSDVNNLRVHERKVFNALQNLRTHWHELYNVLSDLAEIEENERRSMAKARAIKAGIPNF